MKQLSILLLIVYVSACTNKTTPYQAPPLSGTVINQSSLLAHVKYLASDQLKGRETDTQGARASAQYIKNELINYGIGPLPQVGGYFQSFSYHLGRQKNGTNVIAYIKGNNADEILSPRYIVLSAHYDHIGASGDKVYNGADDNASGVAALLELAKVLKGKTKHDIILLFSDGEEDNLRGAKAFVDEFPGIVRDTLLNVNLDMIAGVKNTNKLSYISHNLDQLLSDHKEEEFLRFQYSSWVLVQKGFKRERAAGMWNKRRWKLASDHGVFYRAGIPFIYFGVGTHQHYHQTSDNYDNINKEFFWRASNSIYLHLRYLDQHIGVK